MRHLVTVYIVLSLGYRMKHGIMDPIFLQLVFHGNLKDLLRESPAGGSIRYKLNRRASLKDIIESFSVPHTELAKIISDSREVDQHYIPEYQARFDIYPHSSVSESQRQQLYREQLAEGFRFLVDGTALKLARNLRLLGFDTSTEVNRKIVQTANIAVNESRIILSRNRELLQVRNVVFGQLLRSEDFKEQLREVFLRYPLTDQVNPFSRCMLCNGILEKVEKDAILHLLEPLTKKYYHDFKQCGSCEKVYWRGSHHERMLKFVQHLLSD